MKTLYLTDLDGTLLRPDRRLSAFSREGLNALAARGIAVGAATARTAATVVPILRGARFLAPAVLMNGTCLYSLRDERYLSVTPIPRRALEELIGVLHRLGTAGYLYTVGDSLRTWYERDGSPNSVRFREERVRLYGKRFERTADFGSVPGPAVYFSVTDNSEALLPLCDAVRNIPGLQSVFYRDVYAPGQWFFEVCAEGVSKAAAVRTLRRSGEWDRIVAFGDNLNDLPLFEACDVACAVENAAEEVRSAADRIIGTNSSDGVVRWLLENAEP